MCSYISINGNILSNYNTVDIVLNIYLNWEIYKWDKTMTQIQSTTAVSPTIPLDHILWWSLSSDSEIYNTAFIVPREASLQTANLLLVPRRPLSQTAACFFLCACQTQVILPQSLQLQILLQFAHKSTLSKGLSPFHIVLHYVAHVVITFLAILLPQLLEQVEMTDRSHRTHLRLFKVWF